MKYAATNKENICILRMGKRSTGASPKEDLQELWKRIVFNVAVSNTDDHLRNHAFILSEKGFRLSPLFDVNPSIYGDTLSLNISEYDNTMSFDLTLETAKYYGISYNDAKAQIQEIKDIVENNWKNVAEKYGLSRSAILNMEPAFDMKYK